MHMRPGLAVVRLGVRGRGQVTDVENGMCRVVWPDRRESHPQSDLFWVGLSIHTRDGRPGKVIELGARGRVRVRLGNGARCWMSADEIAPRETKQDAVQAVGMTGQTLAEG